MTVDPAKPTLVADYRHDVPLHCCEFDPSGRFVLAGGRDRAVLCLDVAAGKTFRLEGHESWVTGAVRAATGLVLTADFTGRVIAWDCGGESPELRWNLAAHPHSVQTIAVSADGRLLATGDREGVVRVGQVADGACTHALAPLEHPVTALAFLPGGRLVTADRQPKKPRLKVWDLATGEALRTIDVPQLSAYRRVEDIEWGGIRALTVSPDGGTLVACGSHDYAGPAAAFLFDVETGELKRRLASTLKGFCYAAEYHADGFLMTAAGDVGKGEFRAWDPGKDESLATSATAGPSTDLDIAPDGHRFVVTQTTGKGSYPDAGTLSLFAWEQAPAVAELPESATANTGNP